MKEDNHLFIAHSSTGATSDDVWFVDSGCSNHTSGTKSLFRELDESQKSEVKILNGTSITVEGRGTVVVITSHSSVKLIHDMQYIPCLAYNLLSVGQLLESGFSVLFDDSSCIIRDKKMGKFFFFSVQMTKNRMFPFDVLVKNENCALVVQRGAPEDLWHLRYGHLNVKELQLLGNKDMVVGLPKINALNFCEGCVYSK